MTQRTHLARVALNNTGSRCTVDTGHGRFCDAIADEGLPFPICIRHAVKLTIAMTDLVNSHLSLSSMQALYVINDMEGQRAARMKKARFKKDAIMCVYYVALGKHIKIGYTSDLIERMRAYPSGTLLCYEDGDDSLERKRHQEFAEYLDVGREWFLRGPRLIAHIDSLTENP